MVNLINSLMKGIIVAVIVTIIIEMILPEGKNKKYIKTVISIYIVYVIISPIFSKVVNKTIDVSQIIEDYKIPEIELNMIDNSIYIEENYRNRIKDDITLRLSNMGYETTNIDIYINTNDESYGEIEKINLSLKKNQNNNITKIEQIDINNKTEKQETNRISEEDKQKITEYLITNYGVAETNIIIGGLSDER